MLDDAVQVKSFPPVYRGVVIPKGNTVTAHLYMSGQFILVNAQGTSAIIYCYPHCNQVHLFNVGLYTIKLLYSVKSETMTAFPDL